MQWGSVLLWVEKIGTIQNGEASAGYILSYRRVQKSNIVLEIKERTREFPSLFNVWDYRWV